LKESEQRLEQQLQSVNQHLLDQVATLSQALRQSEESIMSEMRTTATRLNDQKTDRVKLGSLLMNIGATLQSHDSAEEVSDLLLELADTIE